jgi:hypothetical protein
MLKKKHPDLLSKILRLIERQAPPPTYYRDRPLD